MTANVIVGAGQSNMVGKATRSDIIPGGLLSFLRASREFERVKIFDSLKRHFDSSFTPSYTWQNLKVGAVNFSNNGWNDGGGGNEQGMRGANLDEYGRGPNREDGFGPEVGMALEHEASANPGDLFLFKKAFGQTKIETWQKGYTPTNSSWFNWLKTDYLRAKTALMDLGYTTINQKAFYWMQGEGNNDGNTTQAQYLALLTQFYNDVTADLGAFGKFIIGQVGTGAIYAAQQEFVALHDDAILLPDTGFATVDGVHYNSRSQIFRGRTVYDAAFSTTTPKQPRIAVATATKTFASLGMNSGNTSVVYEVGTPLKSWIPGRAINPITGITAGKSYYFISDPFFDFGSNIYNP